VVVDPSQFDGLTVQFQYPVFYGYLPDPDFLMNPLDLPSI
jgi:hypothetical protein